MLLHKKNDNLDASSRSLKGYAPEAGFFEGLTNHAQKEIRIDEIRSSAN